MTITHTSYLTAQKIARSEIRLAEAREISDQAERLLQCEHHTFASAVDLLMRLRSEEPDGLSIREQIRLRTDQILKEAQERSEHAS